MPAPSGFDKVLIDGDQLMYVVGFASEGEPLNFVLGTLKRSLDRIQEECQAESREIWIKGDGNFRDDLCVSTGYKSNRTAKKPSTIEQIKAYLIEHQGAKQAHGMEADDQLSVGLYSDYTQGENAVILSSQDKDLLNTPGWHHNHKRGVFWVSEDYAFEHFWTQMLEGDKVDNIPGLPKLPQTAFERYELRNSGILGCGPKRARDIIEQMNVEEIPDRVLQLYLEYAEEFFPRLDWENMAKEYFVEQAQLLWMTRELNHDGTPVLWSPERAELKLYWESDYYDRHASDSLDSV